MNRCCVRKSSGPLDHDVLAQDNHHHCISRNFFLDCYQPRRPGLHSQESIKWGQKSSPPPLLPTPVWYVILYQLSYRSHDRVCCCDLVELSVNCCRIPCWSRIHSRLPFLSDTCALYVIFLSQSASD